jgi:hypothetical protein
VDLGIPQTNALPPRVPDPPPDHGGKDDLKPSKSIHHSMDAAKKHILQKYQVSPNAWLGKGMEADVYAYSIGAVLKVYAGTTSLTQLTTLQHFYDSLERHLVPYALPCMFAVAQEGAFLVTIEQRLYGSPYQVSSYP